MSGDDIVQVNDSLPWWPDGLSLWRRIRCLLGYHIWETRQTAKGHCYGVDTEEGKRKGKFGLQDETPLRLRNQCKYCLSLNQD